MLKICFVLRNEYMAERQSEACEAVSVDCDVEPLHTLKHD